MSVVDRALMLARNHHIELLNHKLGEYYEQLFLASPEISL